ncbi:S8 family serine peptidase [Brevibacillus sp. H7]|uniref:S8 family serine peptidase n=1 Tax=Brevibacillus sp. H7 TaxID=3349138 RepID=UPI0038072AEE
MRLKWHAALSGTIVLSLLVGGFPAMAKKSAERPGKHVQIQAKEGFTLSSSSYERNDSQFQVSSKLVIVQFDGPLEEEWQKRVEKLGVKLGDYLPDFAFVAKVENETERNALKRLPFVKRVMPFHPLFKLSPKLRPALTKSSSVKVAVVGFDKQVDLRRSLGKMHGVSSVRIKKDARRIAELTVSGRNLDSLLESDDIIAVLPVPENRQRNDVAASIIQSDALASTGYTGKGQLVAIADSGLDTGDLDHIHPDLEGQVEELYAHAREHETNDLTGHGTHVVGSVLGTGKASEGRYKGMAPDAKLVFHAIGIDERGSMMIDTQQVLEQAYQDGARIRSDSWGVDDYGEYNLDSLLFDSFLWEHPDLTALVAAGNVGDEGFGTVGSPATAKNVIAVGASENDRADLKDDFADDPAQVADFSSRGPTEDGRFKPDLVAPGTFILSTRSSLAPDDHFWSPFDQYYAFMGGTSMATPVLAGGVAQIRQYLNEKGHSNPSGALIKSMLLSGADILPGEDFFAQGFGRANLQRAMETDTIDEKTGLKTRGKATYRVKVTDKNKPLMITLAWTDYPGSPIASRKLVNNLNLKVKTPRGKTLNGNDFFEEPFHDEVDNLNNVEQVWIAEPETGTYTVTVEGYNVPKGPQPYALTTTGKLVPADIKEVTKKGTVSTAKGKRKHIDYLIAVKKPGMAKLAATWDSDADVNLYLYDRKNNQLASTGSTNNPETLETQLEKSGIYKVRVQIDEGESAAFTLNLSYPGK